MQQNIKSLMGLVLLLLLSVAVGCKRHDGEGLLHPNASDECGALQDCFSCSDTRGKCGWCGGGGCGPTSQGCYSFSAFNASGSLVCHHPEDIFMPSPSFCLDPCTRETRCSSCLPLELPASMMSRGLRCGWASGRQCLLGTQDGPLREMSLLSWKWTNLTESMRNPRLLDSFCAVYGPCEEKTLCGDCVNAFVSEQEGCVFCLDNDTAIGPVGEGGGKCVSERNLVCRTGNVVTWMNSSESCPAMPSAPPPSPGMKMQGAQRQFQVLMLGLFGLFVIGVLLIVNKLNE
jgi:hypothetical protein